VIELVAQGLDNATIGAVRLGISERTVRKLRLHDLQQARRQEIAPKSSCGLEMRGLENSRLDQLGTEKMSSVGPPRRVVTTQQ